MPHTSVESSMFHCHIAMACHLSKYPSKRLFSEHIQSELVYERLGMVSEKLSSLLWICGGILRVWLVSGTATHYIQNYQIGDACTFNLDFHD